jgi:hypothetical protein
VTTTRGSVVCDDVWLADVWSGDVSLAEACTGAVVEASSARARPAPIVERAANSK